MTFNSRLQPITHELDKADMTPIMKKTYQYNADGTLGYLHDVLDNKFDRLNTFDFAGRPVSAKSGAEANGGTEPNPGLYLPYRQSYQFNAFGNMTQRLNLHYNVSTDPNTLLSFNLNYTYQNNRITNTGFQYDADGRILQTASPDSGSMTGYDARGSIISQIDGANDLSVTHSYDGNGTETKRIANNSVRIGQTIYNQETKTYYIKSSVLGGETITEWSSVFVNNTTKVRYKSCVPAAGTVVAYRGHALNYTGTDNVRFEHRDASGLSYRTTTTTGSAVTSWRVEGAPAEMDPMGGNVGVNNPYPDSPPDIPEPVFHNIFSDSQMFVNGQRVTCMADGALANCHTVRNMLANGSGHIDPRTTTADLPGIGIFHYHIDTPAGPVDPKYPDAIQIGSYADWYEIDFGLWNPQQQTPPQETRPPRGPSAPVDPVPFDDNCQTLANIVDQIAKASKNHGAFMQSLINRLFGPGLNANSVQDLQKASGIGRGEFGDSGFKLEFQDSSDQVRHFTGGLWAGYLLGGTVGYVGMNSNEKNREYEVSSSGALSTAARGVLASLFPTTGKTGSAPDVALNGVSTSLGDDLQYMEAHRVDVGDRSWRMVAEHLGYKGLADKIRQLVCE